MKDLPDYVSHFGPHIQGLVDFRKSLGLQPGSYVPELKNFDRFCAQKYPLQNQLTKELILDWGKKRDEENASGHRYRLLTIRQLGKYMKLCGHDAYVLPTEFIEKPWLYDPYLFSDEELRCFFQTIDTISVTSRSMFEAYTLPVFFRVAYGCGLRPNELFNLRRFDVHFSEAYIFVYFSKTKRDRIVPITDDLLLLCEKYDQIMERVTPNRHWFFHIGERIDRKHWFERSLKKYWTVAGLNDRLGKAPRIYDFRHNFATRILMRCVDENQDIMTLMPYLSAYMGHVQLHSTMYYIHLLPERIRNNKLFDWQKFGALLPEVPYEE